MSLMSTFAGNGASILDSIVMNLTFNTQRLQGSVNVHLRAIPNLTYEALVLKLTSANITRMADLS